MVPSVALAVKLGDPLIFEEIVPKPVIAPLVLLKVPAPVIEPPFRVTAWVPMVNVKPELMFNTQLAHPGAAPVPTVKLPMFAPLVAFKETLLLSWTGLWVVLPIVTAEVVAGSAPVLQLVVVSQAFEVRAEPTDRGRLSPARHDQSGRG